jgi:hypothetical protein
MFTNQSFMLQSHRGKVATEQAAGLSHFPCLRNLTGCLVSAGGLSIAYTFLSDFPLTYLTCLVPARPG